MQSTSVLLLLQQTCRRPDHYANNYITSDYWSSLQHKLAKPARQR